MRSFFWLHAGPHLNPHIDHGVLIAALVGLVVLSVGIMAVHVYLIRRHNRRETERLVRVRLGLSRDR